MRRPTPRPWLLLALLTVACAEQGEGERCELSNDDNDCEPGLVCTSLSGLTGETTGAVCCPQSNFTTRICRLKPLDLDTGDDIASDDDAPASDDDAPMSDGGLDAGGATP
jgi:hypothetical protein